jgi:ParB family chromosome partitioning protein
VQVITLNVDDIRRNPYQPRRVMNEGAMQELVASVLEHGILQPILVRRDGEGYQLISGERRLTAARRAGLTTVPAIVKDCDDRVTAEVALVENLQREDITALEAAEAYKRLIDEFGMTQEQIALRLGKSRPAISNTLRLLKLPPDIRDSLARGVITEGHARSLLGIADPAWQHKVWLRIIEDNLSVRDTETIVYGPPETRRGAQEDGAAPGDASRETRHRDATSGGPDPELQALEQRLRLLMGTRVRIRGSRDSGSISIDYFNMEELERICNLLGIL